MSELESSFKYPRHWVPELRVNWINNAISVFWVSKSFYVELTRALTFNCWNEYVNDGGKGDMNRLIMVDRGHQDTWFGGSIKAARTRDVSIGVEIKVARSTHAAVGTWMIVTRTIYAVIGDWIPTATISDSGEF